MHLDTDIGGDPDDACALAMLLGWAGAEVAGITTTIDPGGQRAGCAAHVCDLAGRHGVDVVAGAEVSLTNRVPLPPSVGDRRYWPESVASLPAPPGAALDALVAAIAGGATIVTIGPVTNLAVLEAVRPGALDGARVVTMGGWSEPPPPGYPPWTAERDWNFQWDPRAAAAVCASGADLTLVPVTTTVRAHLRGADLGPLRAMGPLGRLLADQSEAYGSDTATGELARCYPALPDDLVNFHHDPLTCAVACGWNGVEVSELTVAVDEQGGALRLVRDPAGRPVRVVTDVDGGAFSATWMDAVGVACRRA